MTVQTHQLGAPPCFRKSGACKASSALPAGPEVCQEPAGARPEDDGELRSQLPHFQLTEELEDQLDRQSVADELIFDWASRESSALAPLRRHSHARLPLQIRDVLLRFLSHFTQLMGLPQSSWFEAATLLDVYCLHKPGGLDVGVMPATCVALVRMLKKTDNSTLAMRGSNLAAHAVQLAQWVRKLGYEASEPTEEQLNNQESELLEVLRWQVNLPSLESWLSTLCTRFNVLTRGLFAPSMKWVWEQSIFYARVVVMRQATGSGGLSPRDVACGLLGLTLVSARLLPLEALRPDKLDADAWEELFMQSQQQGAVPTCVLQPGHSDRVLELLQVSTGRSFAELQDATEGVAELLCDALNEIQSMRRAQNAQANPVTREH